MALLPIIVAPDPRLKVKATPVETVDSEVRTLLDDMLETMYAAPGVGLAAPQIGVTRRVIVVDAADRNEPPAPLKLVNPEVIWASDDLSSYEEGCLSVPDHYDDVVRPARVRVRYLDETGTSKELDADGLLAVVLQHEIDHLNGTLFVDHLSSLKRNMILRKLTKGKKNGDYEEKAPKPRSA